ncbi:MAG: hypothetical protein HYY14_05985 [Candidatus Omnitrophica bacterium]|nr:hypothetical protein [Candidatus Omnitrophota bacterium]
MTVAARACWIAFMVLAASLPYVVNYAATPEGFHYTWIMPPYHQDSLAYMAWSEQATRGSILFKLKYTALPHAPFLFHPLFLVSGWLKALLSWDPGIIHWIMKGLGIVLFWLVYFRYTDYLKLNPFQQVAATVLVGTSSGFGWLYYGFLGYGVGGNPLHLPPDLWMPETNTFWSLLWNPLFAYSLTVLLLSAYLLDRGTEEADGRSMWLGGLAAGFLTLIHPYHVPLIFTLAAGLAFFRLRGRASAMLARYYGVALPFVAVVFLISKLHPLASQHSISGEMASPPLWSEALGFGLPLVLFLAGVAAGRGDFVKKYLLPVTWIVLALIFSQLPFWFQRKFIFGAHVPLGILAGVAFGIFVAKVAGPWRKPAIAAALLLAAPLTLSTQVFHLALQREIVGSNYEGAYYISDDLRAAMKYLRADSGADDLVFAAESTSTLVPAYSGNTVLWGHWAMSVDWQERRAWKERAFGTGPTEEAARELAKTGVRYVLVDDAFRGSFGDPRPGFFSQYGKVFEKGEVAIYRQEKSRPRLALEGSVEDAEKDGSTRS